MLLFGGVCCSRLASGVVTFPPKYAVIDTDFFDRFEKSKDEGRCTTLARGGFGYVYLFENVVVKEFGEADAAPAGLDHELEFTKKVQGDGIVKLLGSYSPVFSKSIMVFEHAEVGTLEQVSIKDLKCVWDDLIHGLATLMRKKIVHLDIKPDNILLVKEGPQQRARIADFGLAVNTGEELQIVMTSTATVFKDMCEDCKQVSNGDKKGTSSNIESLKELIKCSKHSRNF